MQLQVIKDGYGNNSGIFVPMNDWDTITQMHQDLKTLVKIESTPKKSMKDFKGCISKETADAMQKHVTKSRDEWEERLVKQF